MKEFNILCNKELSLLEKQNLILMNISGKYKDSKSPQVNDCNIKFPDIHLFKHNEYHIHQREKTFIDKLQQRNNPNLKSELKEKNIQVLVDPEISPW